MDGQDPQSKSKDAASPGNDPQESKGQGGHGHGPLSEQSVQTPSIDNDSTEAQASSLPVPEEKVEDGESAAHRDEDAENQEPAMSEADGRSGSMEVEATAVADLAEEEQQQEVEEPSEVSTNEGCLLPPNWKHVDLSSLKEELSAEPSRSSPSNSNKDSKLDRPTPKQHFTYTGNDPREFMEGHARLYFLQQSLSGPVPEDYEERQARRAYRNSRRLTAALYNVEPEPGSRRVKLDAEAIRERNYANGGQKQERQQQGQELQQGAATSAATGRSGRCSYEMN